jgi:hypothetical protein
MNNQGFNAEQIIQMYTNIQRLKTIWKIESEEQANIANSRKVKRFSWHVSTLFKDLRLWLLVPKN